MLFLTNHKQGNHVRAIIEAIQHNPPRSGSQIHIQVAHEDFCALLAKKGSCTCHPEVQILGEVQ